MRSSCTLALPHPSIFGKDVSPSVSSAPSCPRMKRISSTPLVPVSDFFSTSAIISSFCALVPSILMIGCSFSIASSDMPLLFSSSFTASRPILSSLSIATVMSTILSASPITSAMPVRILRLFIFICTLTPNFVNISSVICIRSTSLSRESEPTTSTSHW